MFRSSLRVRGPATTFRSGNLLSLIIICTFIVKVKKKQPNLTPFVKENLKNLIYFRHISADNSLFTERTQTVAETQEELSVLICQPLGFVNRLFDPDASLYMFIFTQNR